MAVLTSAQGGTEAISGWTRWELEYVAIIQTPIPSKAPKSAPIIILSVEYVVLFEPLALSELRLAVICVHHALFDNPVFFLHWLFPALTLPLLQFD